MISTKVFVGLADEWRDKAAELRDRFGLDGAAEIFEEHARELDRAVDTWLTEPLSPAEAAEATGYGPEHVRRLIRNGKIPNAGEPGAPKARRGDLPMKPGHDSPVDSAPPAEVSSREQVVQAVVNSD